MTNSNRWNLRITNNCLFADDKKLNKITLQHNARLGLRPYIHPLRSPNGTACLTEDSPWHHPWQHGMQTGFHGVNGCDFWVDPGQSPKQAVGTIECREPRILDNSLSKWEIESMWRHTDDTPLLLERQTWQLHEFDEFVLLDLHWNLLGITNIEIDAAEYGGYFLRMPYRTEYGATVINSEGLAGDDCEQQPASWVSLFMPIEKNTDGAGIVICDHPANSNHPSKWRVDHQRGINPAPCIGAPITIQTGTYVSYNYRNILHDGPLPVKKINELWTNYSSEVIK